MKKKIRVCTSVRTMYNYVFNNACDMTVTLLPRIPTSFAPTRQTKDKFTLTLLKYCSAYIYRWITIENFLGVVCCSVKEMVNVTSERERYDWLNGLSHPDSKK